MRTLLPPDQRTVAVEIRPDGTLVLIAGFHEKDGLLDYTPIPFSAFSQNLVCQDDLVRIVVDAID